jgi:hypothetical protein
VPEGARVLHLAGDVALRIRGCLRVALRDCEQLVGGERRRRFVAAVVEPGELGPRHGSLDHEPQLVITCATAPVDRNFVRDVSDAPELGIASGRAAPMTAPVRDVQRELVPAANARARARVVNLTCWIGARENSTGAAWRNASSDGSTSAKSPRKNPHSSTSFATRPACDLVARCPGLVCRRAERYVRSHKTWHDRAMRISVFLALSILALACGDRSSSGGSHVVTTLADNDVTPVWIGVNAETLLVALAKHDDQYGLVEVDLAKGTTRDVAGALPPGAFALAGDHLFLAEFAGAVGEVQLTSGAYDRFAKLEVSLRSIAVSGDRFVVGAGDQVLIVDRSGTASELAGAGEVSVTSTPAGIFGTSTRGGKVVRIDGDKVTVIAEHQLSPNLVAATKTDVVWTTAEGSELMRNIVAAPLKGGPAKVIATAPPGGHIQSLAANDTRVVYALSAAKGGGIYAVTPGEASKLVAAGKPSRVVVVGSKAIWVEPIAGGWRIQSTSF